jgi:hypothetical protein
MAGFRGLPIFRRTKERFKRWAAIKGESEPSARTTVEPPKPKRQISAEGRKRIIAATKKRWRLARAAKAQAATKTSAKSARKTSAKPASPSQAGTAQ